MAYISGVYFTYGTIPFIFISVPLMFFISFSILPNTPQYYLIRKKYQVSLVNENHELNGMQMIIVIILARGKIFKIL